MWCFFFFSSRRRHTRCSRDWSSDVCSSDLRLHVFAIPLPPLGERPEDILPLLEHFVAELGPVVLGRPAAGISREAREHFLAYGWPGNVRELRNAVERALILCEGGHINPEHLPWHAES